MGVGGLCLKSISSHSESFWKINWSENVGIPTSVLTFLGGQNFFFLQKCPDIGLASLKKYIVFFVSLGGGGGPVTM